MEKTALFVFRGDYMCFIHVLLNGLDMHSRNYDVRIVLEGESTKLLPDLIDDTKPLKKLWEEAKAKNLIEGVCKGCASKMGTIRDAEEQGLKLLGDMSGHPPMAQYIDKGYKIITF